MTPAEAQAIGFDFTLKMRESWPASADVEQWLALCKERILAEISVETVEKARRDWMVYGVLSVTAATPAL